MSEKIAGYDVHPLAEAFPLITGTEFEELIKSIKENGQREPVIVDDEDRILDGRNRARACQHLEIDPDVEVFDGDDPLAFVIDANIHRRHLNTSQRAMVADKLATLAQGMSRSSPDTKTQREASELMRVSRRSTQKARKLRDEASPELVEQVESGKKTLNRALREFNIKKAVEQIESEPEPIPEGPFRIIIADPPWRYEKRKEDGTSRGHVDYPGMSYNEIADLPIDDISHDDCILWLWTTNAHWQEAGELIDLWGFTAKTILTWDKMKIGTGDWLRGQTEHCIMAVKGNPVVTLTNQSTLIQERPREHSRKPEKFYEIVESLCHGSTLEMFAREPRDGYVTWGAEKTKFTGEKNGNQATED